VDAGRGIKNKQRHANSRGVKADSRVETEVRWFSETARIAVLTRQDGVRVRVDA
jgi:hypothetical protein